MRIERLPFTVYDIIGYLVPGLVFILGLVEILVHDGSVFVIATPNELNTVHKIVLFFGLLVFGYTAGHVIAYLSSVTIESPIYSILGYPSHYLTTSSDAHEPHAKRRITNSLAQTTSTLRFLISSPIFLPMAIILAGLNLINKTWFLTKPMRRFTLDLLSLRFRFVFGYELQRLSSDEWFKLIESYVSNNNPSAGHRAYNYVVLYGFLRNMAFVFAMLSWANALRSLARSSSEDNLEGLFLNIAIFCLAANIICIFGFAKFSRRYSQEMIMGFLMDREPKEIWRPDKP